MVGQHFHIRRRRECLGLYPKNTVWQY